MEKVPATHKQRQRLSELKSDVSTWLDSWRDINEYMLPRKGRYLFGDDSGQHNNGSKKHSKIINGSAADAIRIIAAGMQGGLTSPSKPWFRLGLADPDLMEFGPVREYLDKVRNIMLMIFARSNFYGSMHAGYKELAPFGTWAAMMDEDLDNGLRVRPYTIGEYMIFLDGLYRPAGLYRQFSMTAYQLVDKFGLGAVSEPVSSAYKNGARNNRFEIVHAVEPNDQYNKNKEDHRGKKYLSLYFELNSDPDKVLRRKGYRTVPFLAPRWDVTGCDTYGDGIGFDAVGDVKMLQKLESEKLEALAKMNRPPMNAPIAMKGKGGSVVPGGVTYVDASAGGQKFEPTYLVDPRIQELVYEIQNVEARIRRFFFNDMFLAIIQNERTITATEVAKRYEEKMIVLGPVIERLQYEALDPIIERVFSIMQELDLLPPPPKEIEGLDINVQYISVLAQAQKMIGISALEQVSTFVGNLSQFFPYVKDKFDADQVVDEYADMVGTSPKVIRSDEAVAKIRDDNIKREQAAQAAQAVAQGAQTAQTLSQAKMGEGNALDALMKGVSGVVPAVN